jgi:hypothetical protein
MNSRKRTVQIAGVLIALVAGATTCGIFVKSAAADNMLRAGACAVETTPTQLPVPISGGILPRFTSKVNDPLHARCLVLDDGQTQIAVAIVDILILSREQADKAKALTSQTTGIPPHCILIAATHTHSAPAVMAAHATDPDEDHAEFLIARIAEGIARAKQNLQPARIGWAIGKDDKNVFCRRYLMKPGTAELQAIRIGDLGITALPCEAFGSTGLEIKRKSPLQPTFNIDLANGYFGYLPPPEQHKLGGYTTWRARTSMLEVDAEPKVVTTILEMLEGVANRRSSEQAVKH